MQHSILPEHRSWDSHCLCLNFSFLLLVAGQATAVAVVVVNNTLTESLLHNIVYQIHRGTDIIEYHPSFWREGLTSRHGLTGRLQQLHHVTTVMQQRQPVLTRLCCTDTFSWQLPCTKVGWS